MLAANSTTPVYRYFYTHRFDSGPYMGMGAAHGFELPFLFHVFDPDWFPTGPSAAEVALSDALMAYWARFAATGDPNGAGAAPWPVYASATDPFIVLDDPLATGSSLRTARCEFWNANGY